MGKTTFSRLLALKLSMKHIDLGELVKRENLICGMDEVRGTLIMDSEKVTERLNKLVSESNQDVLIDGHYAVDVVVADTVFMVFVLRRAPDELKEFMEKRGFTEGELWENLAAEILDVCLFDAVKVCGFDKVCEIDMSGKEIKEGVEEAISILKEKRQCQVGIVDWLGNLEREGRLYDFFKS
ncbi:adenylate kinase family protein [Candidatus Bathyarchaeota archaeon]|nr:adenylate kinase family protein [Candidatus Bathyarchaeota archaeon]